MTAQRPPGHWRGSRPYPVVDGQVRRLRWDRIAALVVAAALSIAFWCAAALLVLRLFGG